MISGLLAVSVMAVGMTAAPASVSSDMCASLLRAAIAERHLGATLARALAWVTDACVA